MKEGKRIKKLLLGAAVTVMAMLCTVSVSAATRRLSTTVKKGECIHLVNENISNNAISKYTLQITPSSGGRYDIVYAYGAEAMALKNCRKSSKITNSTYFKDNRTANRGIIACIKATSGSLNVKVTLTSKNSKAIIKRGNMSKNHSPLYSKKASKGGKIWLKRTGGNITTLPLVISAKSGAVMQRTLNAAAYERYDFKDKYVLLRRYENKKKTLQKNRSYATAYGNARYYSCLIPANSKGVAYTGNMITKKGTITYYYPSDYLKVTGVNQKAS